MNGRHPSFDGWKQRARPSYMRQLLRAGAVGFARSGPSPLNDTVRRAKLRQGEGSGKRRPG